LRVLLTGATGLIGSAVLARLMAEGHEVVAVARPGGTRQGLRAARWLPMDIAKAGQVADWLPHLAGVDAVVNCAGVLQDGMRDLACAAARTGNTLPPEYHRLFRTWFAFGFPAFAAVLANLWLMIAKPQIGM
jgi:uncharacterized protein YbjT (DUF2867 family)